MGKQISENQNNDALACRETTNIYNIDDFTSNEDIYHSASEEEIAKF